MKGVARFGVSLERELLAAFDRQIAGKGYATRSEALRDLIRKTLVEDEWAGNHETVGTVTIVYDHHVRDLTERLTTLQHRAQHLIVSSLHVHLDHDHCLEVLVLRGKGVAIRRVADALIGMKGVKHGKLAMTTTGKRLA